MNTTKYEFSRRQAIVREKKIAYHVEIISTSFRKMADAVQINSAQTRRNDTNPTVPKRRVSKSRA